MGHDRYATLGRGETGARAALPIWIEFMSHALENKPYHYFDIPDNVVRVHMDPVTGARSSENAPEAVSVLFRKGTEPAPFH